MFGLLESLCTAIGTAIFCASGPSELVVNLDRRTYRYVYGWLFHTQEIRGNVDEDMAGIYVRCVQINVRYDVGIVWKHKPGWHLLEGFNRSGRADRFAEETAALMRLPIVSPHSTLKSSSNVRDGLP